jgi:hypothetical protein
MPHYDILLFLFPPHFKNPNPKKEVVGKVKRVVLIVGNFPNKNSKNGQNRLKFSRAYLLNP